MFCFSHANHIRTNLKKFFSSKLDKATLFTHSFDSWNLENLYKQAVNFFAKADILSKKNLYFGMHLFAKQELITREQDFGTGKNFCFNQCDIKELLSFMQTLDFVSGLHNCLEFSQPLSCLYQAMQTWKTFSIV